MAKSPAIPNRSQLAAALDVDPGTITRLLAREDWPVRNAPPWTIADVAVIQRWRQQELQEDRAALAHQPQTGKGGKLRERKLAAEIRKITAQAEQAELKLAQDRGELLPRTEVEEGRLARIQAVRTQLEGIGNLAPRLHGLSPAAIEDELEKWARGVCAEFERA
jgi:hypothetical protein